MRLFRRVTLAAVLGCAVLAGAPVAAAQPADAEASSEPTKEELAAARKLFGDALKLEKQDDWAGALEKLEKVAQIKMTPQVRFHVALCHENLGRLVDAINGFELAAQEAATAGPSARAVEQNAPKRAEALRGRVAHLTLTLQGRRTVSEVLLDGNPVSDALFGTDLPVDPGEHRVEVKRDGEVTFEETLTFEEAESRSLELTIDDPEVVPQPPKPAPGGGGDRPGEEQRIPAYVVGGLGVAGLVAGGVLWSIRESRLAAVASRCEDPETFSGCLPEDEHNVQAAFNLDVASKVSFGVGGAALVTGVVLFFALAPDDGPAAEADGEASQEPASEVRVLPLITPSRDGIGYGGIGISGTF